MPTPVWPADKGFCLADGFDEQLGDLARRSEVDAGPAKQNRTTTAAPSQIQVAYLLTSAERVWLREFYKVDAAGGAVWFEWTHPVELTVCLARFLVGNPPRYRPYKPDWIATLTLEVIVVPAEIETP